MVAEWREHQADLRMKQCPVTSLKAHSQHLEALVSFTFEKLEQAIKVTCASLREAKMHILVAFGGILPQSHHFKEHFIFSHNKGLELLLMNNTDVATISLLTLSFLQAEV